MLSYPQLSYLQREATEDAVARLQDDAIARALEQLPGWERRDDAIVRDVRFPVQGFQRTYWEFFSGFGFFVTTLLLVVAPLS